MHCGVVWGQGLGVACLKWAQDAEDSSEDSLAWAARAVSAEATASPPRRQSGCVACARGGGAGANGDGNVGGAKAELGSSREGGGGGAGEVPRIPWSLCGSEFYCGVVSL